MTTNQKQKKEEKGEGREIEEKEEILRNTSLSGFSCLCNFCHL